MNPNRFAAKLTYALVVASLLFCASTALAQTPPICVNEGEKLNCRLDPNDPRGFPVEFYNVGAILRVEVEETGTNLVLGLIRESGRVAVSNFGDGHGRETITYVADKPGLYLVVVRAQEESEGGTYKLRQSGGSAATEADRQRMEAEKLLAETWINIKKGGHEGARNAVVILTKALSLWQQLHENYWTSYTMMYLAKSYEYLGEHEKALDFYLKALSLKETVGDDWGKATALISISQIYDVKAPKEALIYAEKALALMERLGDIYGQAIALDDIGKIKMRSDQPRQALSYFYHALALWKVNRSESGEATTLNNLMQAWKQLGNLPLAACYGKMGVNKHQFLRTVSALGLELQKVYVNSVDFNYDALANILIAQDRLKEAHQTINFLKDQEFFDFNDGKRSAPEILVVTAGERTFITHYEHALERTISSGKQLIDSNKSSVGSKSRIEDASVVNELQTKWRKALEEFNLALSAAEADLKQSSSLPEKDLQIADTQEMQAALRTLNALGKGQAVAVYTLVGAENFNALIVTEKDLYGISLPIPEETINVKAQQLWGLLQSDNYDPKILSQELHNLIFQPIKAKLPVDTKTILWSLDGNLRYLPMGALYDGKQYLVERYNHVNFTRADSERMTRVPSRQWTGLGLGSSQEHTVELGGSRLRFGALPGVDEELRAVFGSAGHGSGVLEGEVLPDDKFTKAAMLAALRRRRPVVHIASHFSFRPGDEARSFLLLGDGSVLTLAEMKAQKDLFAGVELLTLSACNTAAQQADADGREIDAFAELAQRLGANAVMATLWPLADESAPRLMGEFYRKRQAGGGMVKAEALREAQLALLTGNARIKFSNKPRRAGPDPARVAIVSKAEQRGGRGTRSDIIFVEAKNAPSYKRDRRKPFAHPYYWAPVILIGNLR